MTNYVEKIVQEFNKLAAKNQWKYKMNYISEHGRKYDKVWHCDENGKKTSIHLFVDKKTGDIYKPASIKAPMLNMVRYNVSTEEGFNHMLMKFNQSQGFSGYLYADHLE